MWRGRGHPANGLPGGNAALDFLGGVTSLGVLGSENEAVLVAAGVWGAQRSVSHQQEPIQSAPAQEEEEEPRRTMTRFMPRKPRSPHRDTQRPTQENRNRKVPKHAAPPAARERRCWCY